MTFRFTAIVLAFLLPTAFASATEFESAYTRLDLDGCLILNTEEEVNENQGAEWVCPGLNRIVVWVAEGDLRMFLGYGSGGREQCSYNQTLSPFNTVHTTLEWRLRRGRPVATILRYFIEQDGNKSQHLVVTKVSKAEACHVAVVDGSEPDANELAREAADRFAERFDCETDHPFYYSAAGKSPDGPLGISDCPQE